MTTAPMPSDPRPDRSDPRADRSDWPGYVQPGYGQPGYEQPGYEQPGHEQPEYGQAGRAPRQSDRRPSDRPAVDAARLWAGGIATAIVACLIGVVGVLVCRWLFNIPLLAPKSDGAYGDVRTTGLMLAAAAAALAATGLVHLLLLSTPRPLTFFGWIIGLATVLAVVVPFSTSAPLNAKIATAVVDLILGLAIGTLIGGVAARSVRPRRAGSYPAAPYGFDDRNTPPPFS